ncbi:hypothetical protein NLJ89_g5100 [Agrocybe chaxingu]|uniref:Uncharacterized protein n=1 Tax=Agrocybe chaxingu TaxID=84603 RepID=A0A9W8K7U4_9AGAR|nr:hypothetical protein NLJ89_g5100 [Agrocybe chaxingu]
MPSCSSLNWETEALPFLPRAGDTSPVAIKFVRGIMSNSYSSRSSPANVQSTLVQEVQWFKDADGKEHEFLVVRAVHNIVEEVVLRFERAPYLYPPGPECMGLGQRLCLPTQGVPASDTVTRVDITDSLFGSSSAPLLVASFESFCTPLSLRDFILAANQVSSYSSYTVLKHQCYWFVRTLIGVIDANYSPQGKRYEEAFARSGAYSLAGCIPVPLNVENPNEVAEISTRLKEEIKEDDDLIYQGWMAGAGGKAREIERVQHEHGRRIAAEEAESSAQADLARLREENRKLQEERERLISMIAGKP